MLASSDNISPKRLDVTITRTSIAQNPQNKSLQKPFSEAPQFTKKLRLPLPIFQKQKTNFLKMQN